MLFDTKFDFIFSLGEKCSCTSYLRKFNLQNFSYPFDWIKGSTLECRINLLLNDFEGFCDKDDLEQVTLEDGCGDEKCDFYHNKTNSLDFVHDFRINVPFAEAYAQVKEKYTRRINRLYGNIQKSKKVLMVWFSEQEITNTDYIQSAYEQLQHKFSQQEIYLLLLGNSQEESQLILKNGHIIIMHYENAKLSSDAIHPVMGNTQKNKEIFSQIKKRRLLKDIPKETFYFLIKKLIVVVPGRERRKYLRECFDKYFYKAPL